MIGRRGFLRGLVGILAAPAIVRVASIMPVVSIPDDIIVFGYDGPVDFQFTANTMTLTIEEFSERYLKPAAAELMRQTDWATMSAFTAQMDRWAA